MREATSSSAGMATLSIPASAFCAARFTIPSRVSNVALPMWGTITHLHYKTKSTIKVISDTFSQHETKEEKKEGQFGEGYTYPGSRTSGWSAPIWGSPSTTSRPAPQIHPSRNACASASESTSVPRAAFTSTACFFILRKKSPLTTCRVSCPPGASTKSTSLSRASSSSSTRRTERRLCCAARDASSAVLRGELGLDVYIQCVRLKEARRFSVAWAMRPKPRKPAVRVGASVLVLSWGPVKKNGAKLKLGH